MYGIEAAACQPDECTSDDDAVGDLGDLSGQLRAAYAEADGQIGAFAKRPAFRYGTYPLHEIA